MKKMTKIERINAVINGEPTDRVPVSFWRHFYDAEETGKGLASAMLGFQEEYDWDFMKVNPRASYHHEDWGATYQFFRDGFKKPERILFPVRKPSDLSRIEPLDPIRTKVLKEHIDALHFIKKGLPSSMYFVMTIFTPLSILADMTASRDVFGEYLKQEPALVEKALGAVTETFERFIYEILNVGVSGIYYATTHWGNYDRLTDEQFERFSKPYDKRILSLVQACPFNILHVCKSNNMLAKLANYPVQAFSWDTEDPTNPGLKEGRQLVKKTVIGGIDFKEVLPDGKPSDCTDQAEKAFQDMRGMGFILGAGCTFEPRVPSANLKALRQWAEDRTIVKT